MFGLNSPASLLTVSGGELADCAFDTVHTGTRKERRDSVSIPYILGHGLMVGTVYCMATKSRGCNIDISVIPSQFLVCAQATRHTTENAQISPGISTLIKQALGHRSTGTVLWRKDLVGR